MTRRGFAALALPLVLSAAVYWPILGNYFWYDDFEHLWEMADQDLLPVLLRPHGGHVFPVRNLLFYARYHLFGFDPQPYFVLVLATHLVNVSLLFLLLSELGAGQVIAAFGATLWGILPVQEGTLGWYSVYGQVLSATALLWFLREVARAAKAPARLTKWRVMGWCAVLLAGALCFGTGLSAALVAGLVALLLLPGSRSRRRAVAVLCSLLIVAPLLYTGCVWLDARLGDPRAREVALPPHLQRDVPVIGQAWARLIGNAVTSTLSPGLCDAGPPGWWPCGVLATVFGCAVIAAMVGSPAPLRRQLAACSVLLLAVYGMIALGRAPVAWYFHETLPQLGATPRYHYMGTLPIVLMLSGLLARLRGLSVRPTWLGRAVLATWLGVVIGLRLRGPGIGQHDDARAETVAALTRIGTLIDAAPPNSAVYIENHGFAGIGRGRFPGWAALFIITQPDDVVRTRHVYFVETDRVALAALRALPARRTLTLVVGRDEVPSGVPVAVP